MLLIPFTFLPPLAARYVWLFCNLLFTAGIVFLLRKTFFKDTDGFLFAFLMLFMISGTPYRNQLGVGQHTLFAFFFFLLAVYFLSLEGKKGFFAVTASIFVCFFKYTLTVPLVIYFVYKKRIKEIAVAGALHVLLTVLAAFWLKDSIINMIIKPLKVSSALVSEGGIDFGALLKGSPFSYVLCLAVLVLLFVYAVKICNREGFDDLFISLLTVWSLIVTYHRTYDFFVLIIVAVLVTDVYTQGLCEKKDPGDRGGIRFYRIFTWYYALLMIYINYVLRIFSENAPSKAGAAILYYIFAITLGVIAVRKLKNG
ncbi:MAG: glycosyltransferase 87 family protein, partial [Lachnospiraceae bacterium]|nr:glycosyltransferase 87 family protein [Lachnospiraceae bacterium]